ncbi:MAG: type II toxin-antitoxin system RelE/ParE family toxin [Verrucomicrobia bacterium]|nr:type II toxin-antitoxin system RelE/ParE family toxin [Verrucomicrobiota bacterium]
MILSFRCAETEKIFHGQRSRKLAQDMQQTARRKLEYLHRARSLTDLQSPPGNHLEALRGDRKSQHCIRVNALWRICFRWRNGQAEAVEIVDYH